MSVPMNQTAKMYLKNYHKSTMKETEVPIGTAAPSDLVPQKLCPYTGNAEKSYTKNRPVQKMKKKNCCPSSCNNGVSFVIVSITCNYIIM